MRNRQYEDMTIAELKKEQQRLWEVAIQAQRDANKGGNGEELHHQRASYAIGEVNKIAEELRRRER